MSRFRRNLAVLEELPPGQVSRVSLMPWFQQLGARSQLMANDSLNELKLVYSKMIDWGVHLGVNPVLGMKRFPKGRARSRFVQLDELPPLLDSLFLEPLAYQLLFLLCLNVGCRPGEALQMEWKQVKFWQDHDQRTGQSVWRGRWTKPTTKTGIPHIVPIPEDLVARFQELPRSSVWVFTGELTHPRRVSPGPISYANVHKTWRRVCRRVGLDDVTTYDLRRTCATYLVNRGTNIALVSKGVLNHTNMQHTGVYTQAMMEPVQDALQEHSEFVMRRGRMAIASPIVNLPPPALYPVSRPSLNEIDWPG